MVKINFINADKISQAQPMKLFLVIGSSLEYKIGFRIILLFDKLTGGPLLCKFAQHGWGSSAVQVCTTAPAFADITIK